MFMSDQLAGLIGLVESLQKKIDNKSGINNEMTTRYSLIDPVLRGLGWDTEDPSMVVPEYRSGAFSADYALFNDKDKPTVIIEAKKLGEPLESAAEQAINHCMMKGIRYFAVTDGDRWRVYESHKVAELRDKLIQEFNISSMKPADVCVKMLVLWHRNIGMQSVAVPEPHTQPAFSLPTSDVDTGRTDTPYPTSWKSITSLTYTKGDSSPTQIKFPDGSTANIKPWVDILVQTATWLIKNDYIIKDHCPIKGGRTRFIMSTRPTHGNKKPFQNKLKIRGLYLERNYDPKNVLDMSKLLVKHARLDPQKFELKT